MTTGISWTDEVWNPVIGCDKVSQGCKFCYAKTLHDMRHKAYLEGKLQNVPQYAEPFETVQLMPDRLGLPLSWRKPRRIFVNSMSDLFHDDVPVNFLARAWAVMALSPRHTYQVLTKRPRRMRDVLSAPGFYRMVLNEADALRVDRPALGMIPVSDPRHAAFYPHVWLGVSVENQATADERIPLLLQTPAAIRFLSCEPLLGPVDVARHLWPSHASWPSRFRSPEDAIAHGATVNYAPQCLISQAWADSLIRWVIVGGESGNAKQDVRPMHPDWVRSLRDQCSRSATPFHFKQWGDYREYDDGDGLGTRQIFTGTAHADVVATAAINPAWVDARGNRFDDPDNLPEETPCRLVERVGTKRAGRMLDGRTWDEFPAVRA